MMNKIVAKDKKHLELLIKREIKGNGPNCDLNHIDVSNVTNMSGMFEYTTFNQDISKWNVSNVTNMHAMFWNSLFNQDISNWNVSNVTNIRSMFKNTHNPTRFKWNIEKVLTVNIDKIDYDNRFRQLIVGLY